MRFTRFFVVMMLIASVFVSAHAQVVEGQQLSHPKIHISLQSYNPFPAEPGSRVTLKFRATNVGGEVAQNPSIEIDPRYPFSALPGEDSVKSFGRMAPRESVTFEYDVRVADDAVIGTSPIRLKHTHDGDAWTVTDHDVYVRLEESILSVNSVNTEPEMLIPGDVTNLKITLENSGSAAVRDVSLKLDFDSADAALQERLPFAPSGSTGEKRVRNIEGGESKELEYNIMTFSDADSGIYRLPIRMSYRDDSGEMVTSMDSIGLIVGAEPRLSATIDSIDYTPGKSELSFRIVNRGVTELKFVNAILGASDSYEILSTSDEFYIGRLSSDDFDSISFTVAFDENAEEIVIPLSLDYLDANNREHLDNFELTMDMSSIRRMSSQDAGAGWGMFLLLAAVIGGFLIYRRKKAQNRRRR